MEVVRWRDSAAQTQFPKVAAAHMNHALLLLQWPLDHQQRCAMNQRAIGLEHIWSDYYIRNPGLILERDEEEAFRGPRPLPHDYRSRGLHPRTVICISQFCRTEYSTGPQPCSQMGHQMRPGRNAGGGVVGERLLDRPHLWKR